ncbi:DUF6999 family protein [Sphingomicrobium sediminis]|uniref:Uncharacterized protein n=1 Tax=Sphingomicrobium sediminis TaxID=2950949 RepID=A0A9X2J3P6_9SPHN|nr:hypothetical protein [Sphingomicrobium sediminis]MCM8556422.1 hypothetical protein [Sphingomicrobium sediminis]
MSRHLGGRGRGDEDFFEADDVMHQPVDRRDPDPWLALWLDKSLPFAPHAKAALIRDQRSFSRQFLLPVVRPFAKLMIIFAQFIHMLTPNFPHAPKFLHWSIAFGMKHFLTPDANMLILRHFHLGAQILRFISDNATPGFHPELEPMQPQTFADVKKNLFLNHDLNVYNYVIALNQELDRRGEVIAKKDKIDYSALHDDIEFEPFKNGRLNLIDLQTAIEIYTPAYAMLLTDRDFWRAANSLQLDETIGLYCARLTGEEKHLAMVNNRHPLVPHSTLQAGYRLMLHGLSTEVLHGFLMQLKARDEARQAA